jgi:hypothetical protein
MSAPKPFQKAAVDAAFAAFTDLGSRRRFLVADEVGLGKPSWPRSWLAAWPRTAAAP